MREFSEKELQEEYKNLKMTEIPDMWDDIERNLAPKKKKVISLRVLGSVAAVFAAVILIGPVLHVIQQGGMVSMDMLTNESASMMESAESVVEDNESVESIVEDNESAENVVQDMENVENMVEDNGGNYAEVNVGADTGDRKESTETEYTSNEQTAPKWNIIELEVEIQNTRAESGQLVITAKVLSPVDDSYAAGDVVEIRGNEEQYQASDFAGVMSLQVEKKEENLILLEIF